MYFFQSMIPCKVILFYSLRARHGPYTCMVMVLARKERGVGLGQCLECSIPNRQVSCFYRSSVHPKCAPMRIVIKVWFTALGIELGYVDLMSSYLLRYALCVDIKKLDPNSQYILCLFYLMPLLYYRGLLCNDGPLLNRTILRLKLFLGEKVALVRTTFALMTSDKVLLLF